MKYLSNFLVVSVFPSWSAMFRLTAGLGRKGEGNLNSLLINCIAFKKKGNVSFQKSALGLGESRVGKFPFG